MATRPPIRPRDRRGAPKEPCHATTPTLDGLRGDLSRRRFLAATAAAGLSTACGSDATSSPAVLATGPWTFNDDRGVEVTRPSRPSRIVTNDQAGAV
jgi:hypothetical protein